MFVLDTDHLSLLERPDTAAAVRLQSRLGRVPSEEIATTVVTYEEQTRGWFALLTKAKTLVAQVDAYRRLNRHIENYRTMPALPFDAIAATEYQRLSKLRLKVGPMDLKIAAIAIVNDAVILTRNLRDFRQIPNVVCEDWSA